MAVMKCGLDTSLICGKNDCEFYKECPQHWSNSIEGFVPDECSKQLFEELQQGLQQFEIKMQARKQKAAEIAERRKQLEEEVERMPE